MTGGLHKIQCQSWCIQWDTIRNSEPKLIKFEKLSSMGNNLDSHKICASFNPFREQFYKLYSPVGHIAHERFGFIDLYRQNHTHKVNLFVKDINLASRQQLISLSQKLSLRVSQMHPNLLRVYDFVGSQVDEACGSLNTIKVYVEYIEGNLKRQIKHRRKYKNYSFSQQQLQKILYQLISALAYLHQRKEFHGEIKMTDILVDENNQIKLIDKVIATSSFKLGQQGQSISILRGKGILFAPSIMKCLENKKTQINAYDPFKADVFSVGMVMLEAASFEDSDLSYDYQRFLIRRERLDLILNQLKALYSPRFVGIIESMLVEYDNQRPTAQQVLYSIEELGRTKSSIFGSKGEPLMLGQGDGVNITFS